MKRKAHPGMRYREYPEDTILRKPKADLKRTCKDAPVPAHLSKSSDSCKGDDVWDSRGPSLHGCGILSSRPVPPLSFQGRSVLELLWDQQLARSERTSGILMR